VAAEPEAEPEPEEVPEPIAAPEPAPEPEPVAEVEDGAAAQPVAMDAAREGGPDDLKRIKGVGPKLEQLLHSLGIYHFDQIAAWGASEVAWMDDNLQGFRGRVTRDDWVAQAGLLAAGEETDFSRKVDEGDVY
jgi:predicted flap endonuclease-1-like 5' DNA nuclease